MLNKKIEHQNQITLRAKKIFTAHITPSSPEYFAESVFVKKWSAAECTKTSVEKYFRVKLFVRLSLTTILPKKLAQLVLEKTKP